MVRCFCTEVLITPLEEKYLVASTVQWGFIVARSNNVKWFTAVVWWFVCSCFIRLFCILVRSFYSHGNKYHGTFTVLHDMIVCQVMVNVPKCRLCLLINLNHLCARQILVLDNTKTVTIMYSAYLVLSKFICDLCTKNIRNSIAKKLSML